MDDWKAKLGAAFGVDPEEGKARAELAEAARIESEKPTTALQAQGKEKVDIMLDRKQRHGKKVTIITGLLCDDDLLNDLASALKQHCSTGGSASEGEILLQGDLRQKVLDYLKAQGFKARII